MRKAETCQIPTDDRRKWMQPSLVVYGDMAALTQQGCDPQTPGCKPKLLGLGDDFSNNISTLGE